MAELPHTPGAVPPAPLLVNEIVAAEMLGGLSVKTLYNWRKDGSLRAVKLGTRTMYPVAELAAFIARKMEAGQ